MHDLVRGYAAWHARQDLGEAGIRAAVERSLDHYLHTAVISSDFLLPFTPAVSAPGVVPEPPAGETGPLDWAGAEHQVLLQAIAQAAAAGLLTRAWQIFACLAWFLVGQGYWADWRAAGQAVLAAAGAAGDQAALGWIHATIGWHGMFTRAHDEDRAHLLQAPNHFRRAGDLSGQAWAHLSAGLACTWTGDWAEAVTQCEPALALFRQADSQAMQGLALAGQGLALAGLGSGHAHLGNYHLARGYARQALEVAREVGDPASLAFAWDAVGLVHSRLGEHHQAISCYRQALAFARERKTPLARRWLVSGLTDFGDACRAAGDLSAAVGAWQQALQILRNLDLPEDPRIRSRLEQADPPGPPGSSPGLRPRPS
jgi:tetratricopeptide (TPR) repeat protein